ncbi:MAG: glycosyltransferase [Methylobacter sp.]
MPKVSVILTSFNHEKYIQEAIDSALNQTFTDFELIIWDDASSDNSWYLINQYSDPRIKAFRNDEQKRGVWGINKAISEIASGEYIAIHHSDDVWELDKLEKQVVFLDANYEIGAVFTHVLAIGEDSSPLTDEKHVYFNIFDQPNRTRHEWLRFFFSSGNALCHPSVLIRKSCYEDCGLYRYGLAQAGDFDMWIRLCLKYEIHVFPEKLVSFRVLIDEANSSGSRPETRIRWLYEFYKLMPNYRELTRFEDLVKVFPSAAKYYRNEESDLDFVLAMVALEETTSTFIQLFSQDLLFEAISDPKRSANIKRLYHFDYNSFIALTAQRDVFAREEVANLWRTLSERDSQVANLNQTVAERNREITSLSQAVAERDGQLASLNQTVAERDEEIGSLNHTVAERGAVINEILSSTSWHLTHVLRVIKTFCVGDGSFLNIKKTPQKRFDAAWYLKRNPDVARSNMDAYEHYMAFGAAERRQPAPDPFFLRNIKRLQLIGKAGPAAVKQVGGIGKTIVRTLDVIKQEGLDGMRSRLINYHQLQNHSLQKSSSASSIMLDEQHRYCLSDRPADYTYIPRHRPDDLQRIIEAMEQQPIFSIIVPVYNTPPELLTKVLDSVISQWYPHWELILADDASTSVLTKEVLAKINDPGIIVLGLPNNQGIAGATNAALARARGEFIVLLDHDDELTDDCLFELALCINHENPDYIYSDEDKISPDGRFTEPHFKPDWSPDTMMSTMYVCHVSCIRRSLLEELGGMRSDYDGCQDWDLVLRLTEKTKRISHIPKVLYHWRIIPASTSSDIAAKPYVLDASRRVREDTLKRRGLIGTVEPVKQVPGYFRVNYHLQAEPVISIIIPTRDNGEILRRCLDSISEQSSYQNFELIVLDNGSVEPATLDYLEQIRTQAHITVIRHDAPFNFSELNNIGVNSSHGDILLFLNDDTEVISADWLERMGGYAQLAHIGAVGAKLLYPGERQIQHAGILNIEHGPDHAFQREYVDAPGYYMRNLLEYNWLAVTGACLMVERAKFQAVGGFDETFPIAYNDVDLCLRLHNAGLYNIVCQAVKLIHHESVSRGHDHLSEARRARLQQEKSRLFNKHPRYFQYDPYHNSNLHPSGTNFEIMR